LVVVVVVVLLLLVLVVVVVLLLLLVRTTSAGARVCREHFHQVVPLRLQFLDHRFQVVVFRRQHFRFLKT